jgi:uncharacterized protein (DUF1499 family)
MRWRRHLTSLISLLVLFVAARLLISLAPRPTNLGTPEGRLTPCPASPNCVCSDRTSPGHAVTALAFTGPADAAWDRLNRAVATLPRTTILRRTDDYLHAECRTLLLNFTDDLEFRLDAAAGVIHVRSASRIGYSDMGVNPARVEAVRTAFERLAQDDAPGG